MDSLGQALFSLDDELDDVSSFFVEPSDFGDPSVFGEPSVGVLVEAPFELP